ncbi:MAG: tetratricopeptide repeat protein [Deltaproteobacteria bacterium]|nr:tetratricopeptide repeat protein [Deltaproteobacteria bacterium]
MNSHIVIKDCYKTYRHDQDKARTPEETVARVKERLEKLKINILSETRRIDTGRLDIPVYISLCGDDATRLTGTKKQMGKGATPIQSEASAVMELMERFSFFSFIRRSSFPLLPYGKVASEAVSPEMLKQSVYDDSTPLDLCREFLQDVPLRWTRATNLTRGEDQWVPIDWFYLINEYNGPAAGNTIEEAILQSLCEVVERHVGSIISYEKRSTPLIDPASLKDPAAVELVEKFRRQGIELYMRDFSLDTGIPTVGALAYDPSTFPQLSEIIFTAGTTSNPEKSLSRALTEIAQLAGDFESRTSYRPTLPKYTSLEEAGYLMENHRTVSIGDLPNLDHDNLKVEIERCVNALRQIGLEVLVIDVTHPELGVPAVYTIVPGAHFLDRTRDTDFAQHAARTLLQSVPIEQIMPHMERLLNLFGPRYDLTFFLAHSLELEGRPETALSLFLQALDQNPDPREIASIYVHIASCRKDLAQYEEALEALAQAEQFNDELKEIYNLRGFCYYQLKRHRDAISAFEKAIELDPGSAIDYANIGSNLRELGFKQEAIRLYRMALELDPDIEFARDNIARLEEAMEKDSTAA